MELDVVRSALALGPLKAVCNVCGKRHVIPPAGSSWTVLSQRARRCLEVRIRDAAKRVTCLASVSGLWRAVSALCDACIGSGLPHAPFRTACSPHDAVLRCTSDVTTLMYCADVVDRCLESVRWRVRGAYCYEYSVYPMDRSPAYVLALDTAEADAQMVMLIGGYVFSLEAWQRMAAMSEAVADCPLSWKGPGQCQPAIIASRARWAIAARDDMRARLEGGDYGFCNGRGGSGRVDVGACRGRV